LKYDKGDERQPFMTWAEVEQRISRGGLGQEDVEELWDCLFLDTRQINELLAHVKEGAAYPFIYPMFVFVAHTPARRSEMMRSRVEDLDFKAGEVVLREKKKDRSVKISFRRLPMSPLFATAMKAWLQDDHPGGPYTFCQLSSRMKRRVEPEPLTTNVARHHFAQTLTGSKWEVVRGFHVFRHSFASNCAAENVNPQLIDAWMGHQTEAMRRRYRHLFPGRARDALLKVYGG
jgi:integrase